MNKARTQLSLRKLFVAMLAAGPVTFLPSQLLAVVPQGTTAPFTIQNGGATWLGSGSSGTINVTNPNSVLVWGTTTGTVGTPYGSGAYQVTDGTSITNFNILAGETFNFNVPAGSAVLNKVTAGTNTTNTMYNGLGTAAAVINGTLNAGSGRVAILANGNIIVGAGAQIITGGLALSTIKEDDNNFTFTSTGNLSLATGNVTQGNIFLGSGSSVATITGNLTAYAANVTTNNLTISGDAIINQTANGVGLVLTSAAPTTVSGNFSATSNAGAISQGAGALTVANGLTSLTTNGNVAVTLANSNNDFNTVRLNVGTIGTAGGDVSLRDINNITLGNAVASTVGNNLTVQAGGAIATGGAVAIGNTVNLTASNGAITFGNNSSAANIFASTSTGAVSINATGNLATKTISAGANDVAIAAGNLTIDGAVTSTSNVTLAGTTITSTALGSISSSGSPAKLVTVTGTTGNVVLPAIASRSLNVQTTGGSISQIGSGGTGVINVTGNALIDGAVTMNAGTGNITLNANNSFGGNNSTVNLTGNTLQVTAASNVVFGNLDAAGSVTINTTPSSFGLGNVTLGFGGGTTSPVIRVGGNLSVTTNGSNVQDDPQANETIFGAVTVNTMAAGYGLLNGSINVTAGGSGFTRAPAVTVSGGGGSGATAVATINTSGAVTGVTLTPGTAGFNGVPTFTFTGGGNAADNVPDAGTVTVTSGFVTAIATTGVDTTGYVSAPTVTFNNTGTNGSGAAATAVINTSTGALTGINITSAGSGYTTAPTYTLVGGTNLGTTAPTLSTANLTIVPQGTVSFTAQGNQGSGTYGQFTVTGGAVSIVERTSLNLGTINAASLSAQSTAGDVLINGPITTVNNGGVSLRANAGNITQINGAISAGTGTLTANINGSNGSVNLTNSSNVFGAISYNSSGSATGNILVASSVSVNTAAVSGNSNITVSTTGTGSNITVNAGSFNGTATFNSSGTINLTSNNSTNTVAARNLVLISADTSADSITQNRAGASQIINVNGTLTLSTPGGVTLNGTNNPSLGNVVLSNVTNPASEIRLSSRGNIALVSGSASGTVNLTSGTVGQNSTPIASTITLGNLNVGNLVASAQNGGDASTSSTASNLPTNGASGDIKQATGSSLHVENTLTAITYNGGNIVLGNTGNSAGRVQLSTAGGYASLIGGQPAGSFAFTQNTNYSGNATYTEDGSVKLGALQVGGTANITSRFGSVIEDSTLGNALNVAGILTLNAPTGSVTIGNTTHTAGVTTASLANVNVSAAGAVSLISSGNLTLGRISANSLSVTAASIAQNSPLSIFGPSTFNATAGGITLTDSSNNFGPVSLILGVGATNNNIAITENGTLNLRTVSTPAVANNGTFTATSVNGDIIDTGLARVVLGGNVTGTTVTTGSGVVSLIATNGNIVIDDSTSDVVSSAGIVFNAKNVTLAVLGNTGSNLVLGANGTASSATGNLTASSALGNIQNAGAMTVSGLASFQTGAGNITINQPNVGFGQLRFAGNEVRISESGNMDIVAGSSAFGQAQLVAGGSISIVPIDGQNVTFGNSVAFQSTGNLTLRSIQVNGTLTLSHTGTANLSALSKSTDLGGRDPVDLGTGAYVGPNQ